VLVKVSPLGTGGRCYFVNGFVLLAGCGFVGRRVMPGDPEREKGRLKELNAWAWVFAFELRGSLAASISLIVGDKYDSAT